LASPDIKSLQDPVRGAHSAAGSREMQDRVIRYLSDARLRRHPPQDLPLSAAEAEKAERFARFLAHRYYRDRLIRSFRYARQLAAVTRQLPEDLTDTEQFARLVGECVLGSLDTAKAVAGMAVTHLMNAVSPGPWWPDLLQYESAFFLQMATADMGPASDRPQRGASATIRRLSWDVPQVVSHLKAREVIAAGKPVDGTTVGASNLDDLRREVALLFSRTREGKVYVVEVEAPTEAVFHAVDGQRTLQQIAAALGAQIEVQTNQILASLSEIGAVVLP
jgi:hypothetical protein